MSESSDEYEVVEIIETTETTTNQDIEVETNTEIETEITAKQKIADRKTVLIDPKDIEQANFMKTNNIDTDFKNGEKITVEKKEEILKTELQPFMIDFKNKKEKEIILQREFIAILGYEINIENEINFSQKKNYDFEFTNFRKINPVRYEYEVLGSGWSYGSGNESSFMCKWKNEKEINLGNMNTNFYIENGLYGGDVIDLDREIEKQKNKNFYFDFEKYRKINAVDYEMDYNQNYLLSLENRNEREIDLVGSCLIVEMGGELNLDKQIEKQKNKNFKFDFKNYRQKNEMEYSEYEEVEIVEVTTKVVTTELNQNELTLQKNQITQIKETTEGEDILIKQNKKNNLGGGQDSNKKIKEGKDSDLDSLKNKKRFGTAESKKSSITLKDVEDNVFSQISYSSKGGSTTSSQDLIRKKRKESSLKNILGITSAILAIISTSLLIQFALVPQIPVPIPIIVNTAGTGSGLPFTPHNMQKANLTFQQDLANHNGTAYHKALNNGQNNTNVLNSQNAANSNTSNLSNNNITNNSNVNNLGKSDTNVNSDIKTFNEGNNISNVSNVQNVNVVKNNQVANSNLNVIVPVGTSGNVQGNEVLNNLNLEESVDNSLTNVSNVDNTDVKVNNEVSENLNIDNKVVTDNNVVNNGNVDNTKHFGLFIGKNDIFHNNEVTNNQNVNVVENNTPIQNEIPVEKNMNIEKNTTIVDNTKIDELTKEIDTLKSKIEQTPEPVVQIEKVIDNTKLDKLTQEIDILKTQIEKSSNQKPIIQTEKIIEKVIDNSKISELTNQLNTLKNQIASQKSNNNTTHQINVKLDPQEVKLNFTQPPSPQSPPQITHIHNIYVKHHINVKKDIIVPHHVIIPHHVVIPHHAIIPHHVVNEEKVIVPHHVVIPHNISTGDDQRFKELEKQILELKENNLKDHKIVNNDVKIHFDVKKDIPNVIKQEKKIFVLPVVVKNKEEQKDGSYTHVRLEQPVDIDDSFNTEDLDDFMRQKKVHSIHKDDSSININSMYSHLFPENDMNDEHSIIATGQEPMVIMGNNAHHHHAHHDIHHVVHHTVHHNVHHNVHDIVHHNIHHNFHHNVNHNIHHNVHHNVNHNIHHNVHHNVNHNVHHNVNHNVHHNVNHSMNYQIQHNMNNLYNGYNSYNQAQNTLTYVNPAQAEGNINEVVHPTTDIYDFQYHPDNNHTTVHKYHPSAYLENYNEEDLTKNLEKEESLTNSEKDQEYYDDENEVKKKNFFKQDKNGVNHKVESTSAKGNSLRDEGSKTILDDHDIVNVVKTDFDEKNVNKNKILSGTFNKSTMDNRNGSHKIMKGGITKNENEKWDDKNYDGKKDNTVYFSEKGNKGEELVGIKSENETKKYNQEELVHKKDSNVKYGYEDGKDIIVGNEQNVKKLAYDQSTLGLLNEKSSSSTGIIDDTIVEKNSKDNRYHHYNKTDSKTATEKEDNIIIKNETLDLEKNKKHLTVNKRRDGESENKYRIENKIGGKINGVDVHHHEKEISVKKNKEGHQIENHIKEHKGSYGNKHHHHRVHKKKVKNDLFEDEQTVSVRNVHHNGLI